MNNVHAHLFAAATPLFAALSQVLIKWQVNQAENIPAGLWEKAWFLVEFLLRPWVIVAIAATFAGGVTWIMAMTKLDLSYAYPYVAAAFIIVPMLGVFLFGESLTMGQMLGGILILVGIAVVMVTG